MRDYVRTTITLPNELFERLKAAAFYQKKSISDLVRDGVSQVVSFRKVKEGVGIRNLEGMYFVKGGKGKFKRNKFYDQLVKKEMST